MNGKSPMGELYPLEEAVVTPDSTRAGNKKKVCLIGSTGVNAVNPIEVSQIRRRITNARRAASAFLRNATYDE